MERFFSLQCQAACSPESQLRLMPRQEQSNGVQHTLMVVMSEKCAGENDTVFFSLFLIRICSLS